jgi:uncharacterized metal-binding protein YceD (DUF177 family)
MTPEFSRPVRIDVIGDAKSVSVEASQAEREALAKRFGLLALNKLEADASLLRKGDEVIASGKLVANVVQSCVATDVPLAEEVSEEFTIIFRPQPARASEEDEIELSESEMDVVFYDGSAIDVGEAVAETLSLSLEPFPRAPDADDVLRQAGVKTEEEAGPFGALAGLREKLSGKE